MEFFITWVAFSIFTGVTLYPAYADALSIDHALAVGECAYTKDQSAKICMDDTGRYQILPPSASTSGVPNAPASSHTPNLKLDKSYHTATVSRAAYDQCTINSLKNNDNMQTLLNKCKPTQDKFCLEMGYRPDGLLLSVIKGDPEDKGCLNLTMAESDNIIRIYGNQAQKTDWLGKDEKAAEEIAMDATITQQAKQRDHILFGHSLPDEIPITKAGNYGRIDPTHPLPLDDNYYVDVKDTTEADEDYTLCFYNAYASGRYNNLDIGVTAYNVLFACRSQAETYVNQCLIHGGYVALCNHMIENSTIVRLQNPNDISLAAIQLKKETNGELFPPPQYPYLRLITSQP